MKKLINYHPVIVMSTCLLLLNACSSHQPYPDTWQALPKNPPDACLLKTGLYENRIPDTPSTHHLSTVFGFPADSDFIHLQTNEQHVLTASAIRYGEIIATKVLDKSGEKPMCKNGWLIFDSSVWVSEQAGLGYQGQVTGLLMHDNYLVEKNSTSFAGWAYILPVIGSGSDWYRFRYVGNLNLDQLKEEALEQHKKGQLRIR